MSKSFVNTRGRKNIFSNLIKKNFLESHYEERVHQDRKLNLQS